MTLIFAYNIFIMRKTLIAVFILVCLRVFINPLHSLIIFSGTKLHGSLSIGNFVYLTRWRGHWSADVCLSWSMFSPVETGANNAQLRQTSADYAIYLVR